MPVGMVYPDGQDCLLLDEAILNKARILENEKVLICNHSNGARFETYALKAAKGSKACFVSGPATRLVHAGDHINITSYARWLSGQIPVGFPVIVVPIKELTKKTALNLKIS
ncbi:aspartate 1-decarboxylase [Mucilaginibacter sp. ZT4R22]|uniref:Aspartate 1-decarboxylase n=2 Tax=Mucilaginibacter pankratovii TaxID=2772110 RepID=A0ABR7WJV8_9SPHI|nr:aspartate 1-decarboxylase [Mucilaginibacter pankratovii]